MSKRTWEHKQSSPGNFSLANVQPAQVVQAVQRTPPGATIYQRVHSNPHSLSPAYIQMLQRTIGNRAVTQQLQRTAGNAGQVPLQKTVPPPPQASTSGLPAPLRAGVENLSGLSMNDVHVHYNSAEPARVEALAYTQGADIHVGPGQEQHLAHEAWHVVQQKQGRVPPTMQTKGVAINDDRGLEREADAMGARAVQMGGEDVHVERGNGRGAKVLQARRLAADAPIQRVYGGMEYTEGGTTVLESYPGNPAGLPAAIPVPAATMIIAGTQIGFYVVHRNDMPPMTAPGWIGPTRYDDHEVFRSGRVKLTNDMDSAEWVIEGHTVHGLNTVQMMQNIVLDIATMYTLRNTLATQVNHLQGIHGANNNIIIAPNAIVDLAHPGPQGLFKYKPDPDSRGMVQLTVQYTNVDTIRRINELNASKYLTGSKIAEGEDIAQVTGNPGFVRWAKQWAKDLLVTSSFSTAHDTLLAGLVAASAPIVVGGVTELTAADVGLIKLMVINDAMASNMVRHASNIGQAQEKNIQRFFPKAERQKYVNAVASNNVSVAALAALRVQITGAAAAMAQLVWNNADPFALRVDETQHELAGPQAGAIASTRRRHALGQTVLPFELAGIKDAVLGPNGGLLAVWIVRATRAYTDSTVGATEHFDIAGAWGHAGHANVIPSTLGFTPVAGPGPGVPLGAIYEFREREIPMAPGHTDAVINALTALFNAS